MRWICLRLPGNAVTHGSLSDRILAHYAGGCSLLGKVKIPANQRNVFLRLTRLVFLQKFGLMIVILGKKVGRLYLGDTCSI